MSVESATYISDLDSTKPGATDLKSEGDDHLRLLKSTLKATFPNVTGAVTPTHLVLNNLAGGTFASVPITGVSNITASGSVTAASFVGTLNGNSTGNAATASAVAWTAVTGRPTALSAFTNDVGYITSPGAAQAGSLTGTTLASNVVSSSLTSLGTLGSLNVTGTATASNFAGPLTGNASTATALQTTRTINGVNFNGTSNITVTADAGSLTGTTLSSSVVASSLTSLGALTSGLAVAGGGIQVGTGSNGYLALQPGDTTHTGYIEFHSGNANRQGYIGFSTNTGGTDNGGTIPFQMATAAFSGAVTVVGSVSSAGNTTSGTLNLSSGTGSLRTNGHISKFESSEVSCPTNTSVLSVSHGGSRPPDQFKVVLRCKTAELGYAVGDEVTIQNDVSINDREYTQYANATNCALHYVGASLNPAIRNISTKSAAAVTAANWRVVFRAIWL